MFRFHYAGQIDEGEDDVLGERSPGRAKACEPWVNRCQPVPIGAGVALFASLGGTLPESIQESVAREAARQPGNRRTNRDGPVAGHVLRVMVKGSVA